MAELSAHLRTLPPEALDVLRYYGKNGSGAAHADDIIAGSAVSDRGFGRAIRRLVTKNYVVMEGEQVYRLSDFGKRAVAELLEYDLETPVEARVSSANTPARGEARQVRRRFLLVAPRTLSAMQPTHVYLAVDDADDDDVVYAPLRVELRAEILHGQPEERSTVVTLENRHVYQTMEVTPGSFTQMRVRIEVRQQDGSSGTSAVGGFYVDLPVSAPDALPGPYAAWASDVLLVDYSTDEFADL
jgi:hypothetical protein